MNNKNIFSFSKELTEGNAQDVNLLGGKGANLCEMCNLGIPVPPGFTISTKCSVEQSKLGCCLCSFGLDML